MIDINELLKDDCVQVGRNKIFRYCRYSKNGLWEIHSIAVCGKEFKFPKMLRKLTRHKRDFTTIQKKER